MSDPVLPDDDADVLAGEYVLRLLDPEEAAGCAARVVRDPAFAAAVARWEADLAALDGAFAPANPPARLLATIEARLFGTTPRTASPLRRAWQSVGLWRAVAAAAVLAAVALPLLPRGTQPVAPELVATVLPDGGGVQLVAVLDPDHTTIHFNRLAGTATPGRSMELWVLPPGAPAPVSLGVIPDAANFAAVVPASLAGQIGPGTQIMVSDEVAGGSPTGQPQGAVLASGAIRAL